MKNWIFCLMCLSVGSPAFAQSIQWASSVVEFSSQATAKENSAAKILGTPNAMPQGGQNPNAWEPKEKKTEYIRVRFATPSKAAKVLVLENYMPGAITKVTAIDAAGQEVVLATYNTPPPPVPCRTLEVPVPNAELAISSIRLDINPYLVIDQPQYDAIGLMAVDGPYNFINLLPNLNLNSRADKLPESINSIYPEDAPLVSFDEKTLYFSRGLHPNNMGGVADIEDIWMSKIQPDGSWGTPVNPGPILNNKDANFIFSETKQGTKVLLGNVYEGKAQMQAGVSIAYKLPNGTFTPPQPVTIKNDQNLNGQVDYVLSASGKIMIISEERDNSLGERDLHVSFLQPDSTWSEPSNLGPMLNTASDEFAPFLAPDERSLFFSTAGRPGFGDVDIYVCTRIGDGWTNWSEPANLGSYINGTLRDSYFSLPARGEYAYFTTVAKGTTETDIYRIAFPKNLDTRPKFITETVASAAKPAPAPTPTPEPPVAKEEPAPAPVVAKAEPAPAPAATPRKEKKKTAVKVIDNPGALSELGFEAIHFDFSKIDINETSYPELGKIAAYLKEHPGAVINISGHTDGVGPEAFNLKLSKARAKKVYDYLVDNGVARKNLKRKGYGETKPKADNATDEGRAENRRVEFVVIKL